MLTLSDRVLFQFASRKRKPAAQAGSRVVFELPEGAPGRGLVDEQFFLQEPVQQAGGADVVDLPRKSCAAKWSRPHEGGQNALHPFQKGVSVLN